VLIFRPEIGLPVPVTIVFLAVAAKLAFVVRPKTQEGANVVYSFDDLDFHWSYPSWGEEALPGRNKSRFRCGARRNWLKKS